MRVSIVTETSSILTNQKDVEENKILWAPMQFTDGENIYTDNGPYRKHDLLSLRKALKDRRVRGTPPPANIYHSLFQKGKQDSDAVFSLLLGQQLATTVLAKIASNHVDEQVPIKTLYLNALGPANVLVSLATVRLAERFDNVDQLENEVQSVIDRTTSIWVVPQFNDFIGKFTTVHHYSELPLKSTPVVIHDDNGAILPLTAVRTPYQAYIAIIDYIKEFSKNDPTPMVYSILNVMAEKEAEGLRNAIKDSFPEAEELVPTNLTLTAACLLGEGAFGIGFGPRID